MLIKIVKKIFRTFKNLFFGVFWYASDAIRYLSLRKRAGENVSLKFFPKILDKDPKSHTFDKHYVYMDRWAFKKILVNMPHEHVDIGSSIRFLSMTSTVSKVKFVDIRPVALDFDNFECVEGSILNLPFKDSSISSLSCLHVAEHIGLGRYGDPLDPLGTVKACKELQRVLSQGGKFYFAVPIGKPAVYFNAHRVFDPEIIPEYFSDLKLIEFSAVNDSGRYINNANLKDFKSVSYSCGMYVFTKE